MKEIIEIIESVNAEIEDAQLEISGEAMPPFGLKTDGANYNVSMFGILIWTSQDGFTDIHADDDLEFTRKNLVRQAVATIHDVIAPCLRQVEIINHTIGK